MIEGDDYKKLVATYITCLRCEACSGFGDQSDTESNLKRCVNCDGNGYHIYQTNDETELIGIQFYKEYIAKRCTTSGEKVDSKEIAKELLASERYREHSAYIMQFKRPLLIDKDWHEVAEETWYAPTVGGTLFHDWAYEGWHPNLFMDDDTLFQNAKQAGIDIKKALSLCDGEVGTPLHRHFPPLDSKIWEYIDPDVLAARNHWGRTSMQGYICEAFTRQLAGKKYPNCPDAANDLPELATRINGLIDNKRLVFNSDIIRTLIEMDARARSESEITLDYKGTAYWNSLCDLGHSDILRVTDNLWTRLIPNLSDLPSFSEDLSREISHADFIYYPYFCHCSDDPGYDEVEGNLRTVMLERLELLLKRLEARQTLETALSEIKPQ